MMTDQELIAQLRSINKNYELARGIHVDIRLAADSIEDLIAENKRLGQQCEGLMQAGMNNGQALIIAEAKLAKAVEALQNLHHAVCGETGFASAVRNHSGKAYPWEALDIADAQTRAVLADLEGK